MDQNRHQSYPFRLSITVHTHTNTVHTQIQYTQVFLQKSQLLFYSYIVKNTYSPIFDPINNQICVITYHQYMFHIIQNQQRCFGSVSMSLLFNHNIINFIKISEIRNLYYYIPTHFDLVSSSSQLLQLQYSVIYCKLWNLNLKSL